MTVIYTKYIAENNVIVELMFCILYQEKEKELDARNIYANRMLKASSRKEAENGSKRKGRSKSHYTAVLGPSYTLKHSVHNYY